MNWMSSLTHTLSTRADNPTYTDDDFDNYNVKDCGFDGGDCCRCSCVKSDVGGCGTSQFVCVDEDSQDCGEEESREWGMPVYC